MIKTTSLKFAFVVLVLCWFIDGRIAISDSAERQNERYGFFELANCTTQCLKQTQLQSFRDCFRLCNHATKLTSNAHELELFSSKYLTADLGLVCRDDSAVYLKFDTQNTTQHYLKYAYFVLVEALEHDNPKPSTHEQVFMSFSPILKITDLEPNTLYYISLAYILDSNHEYISVSNMKEFKTLPVAYTPMDVTKVRFEEFKVNKYNNSLVDCEVKWAPAEDMVCSYDLTVTPVNQELMTRTISVQKPEKLFKVLLDSLLLDQTYTFSVVAKKLQSRKKSSNRYIFFKTPKCEEFHQNEPSLCRR